MKLSNSHALYLSIVVQKPTKVKLVCYERDDYNTEEPHRKHIEWCQKNLELGGNMVDNVNVDDVKFNIHLTH
jgi:hypothetical protein